MENVWFSPGRLGRVQSKTPRREEVEVQISASKYFVLSVDEVEESEVLPEERNEDEEENIEEEVEHDISEEYLLEDEILEQKTRESEKAVV